MTSEPPAPSPASSFRTKVFEIVLREHQHISIRTVGQHFEDLTEGEAMETISGMVRAASLDLLALSASCDAMEITYEDSVLYDEIVFAMAFFLDVDAAGGVTPTQNISFGQKAPRDLPASQLLREASDALLTVSENLLSPQVQEEAAASSLVHPR